MPTWNHKIELGDVFHTEMSWSEKRQAIVTRIVDSTAFCLPDWDLEEIVDEIRASEDANEFDMVWNRFYDWADRNRFWVST